MLHPRQLSLCLSASSAVLLAVATAFILATTTHQPPRDIPQSLNDRFDRALSLCNTAAGKCVGEIPQAGGDWADPFHAPRQALPQTERTVSHALRPSLILRGQLIKDRPLAILEDNTGQTIILGVGDAIGTARVEAIAADRVTLRDGAGTFTIKTSP